MTGFLTLEDINGTLFRNQEFYWHEIRMSNIHPTDDFTNVKLDFCTITRTTAAGDPSCCTYKIVIDNSYWTLGWYYYDRDAGKAKTMNGSLSGNTLTFNTNVRNISVFLYMGLSQYNSLNRFDFILLEDVLDLNYKELNTEQDLHIKYLPNGNEFEFSTAVSAGINDIYDDVNDRHYGFLRVNLIKSDFVFNCSQGLTVGKINKVALGTDSDYLPSGDMIGDNTPTIQVLYGDTYIPVTFDSTLNDYCFNLDLTGKQNEGNVRFKVLIEANDVINETTTDVILTASYETINTEAKLTTLFHNGGTGRIGANITLTDDLTVTNDVYLIGNDKTLTMASHKIIVPTDKTFKANNTAFTGGENTIQQNLGSKVELNNCSFTDCTGLGSVIDCQVDIGSLSNATDFTTILNECSITNCDMAILHGGELTIDNCSIVGKVSDANNPYCLYQTDGTATILRTSFELSSDTQIEEDIGFNPCIFICGTEATINGLGHTNLQANDINSFLEAPQYNSSTIDITYLHSGINDYITIQADNGYCHAVSQVDKIYKTNVTARRVE